MRLSADSEQLIDSIDENLTLIGSLLSIVAALILIPQALKLVNRYQKQLYENYTTTQKRSLKWLKSFLITMLTCSFIWILSFINYQLGFEDSANAIFLVLTLCFVVCMFWIGYFMIIQYSWFEVVP